MPHLFVDISAHGLGHLAQVGPVLNELARRLPQLRFTVRSALPPERLRARIEPPFAHLDTASDIGFCMIDALRIDHAATITAYRTQHRNWQERVEGEAAMLAALGADFVLADVSCLPLAGASRAAIPAAAMCSLNWADLFEFCYGDQQWALPILNQMRVAYAGAPFLSLTPAMPMAWVPQAVPCGPVAESGQARRAELCRHLDLAPATRIVIVALGGIPTRLPVESWSARPDIVWLVPSGWQLASPRCHAFDRLGWPFSDLLASVDAIVAKPGYGTFAEAACNGTPTAYIRREEWPEQDCLIDWIESNARACELTPAMLAAHRVDDCLEALWALPPKPRPLPSGIADAASWLQRAIAPA